MAYIPPAIPFPVPLGLLSATATRSLGFFPKETRNEVIGIDIVEAAAVTGDNTNRYSFSFNKGTIAVPVVIATLDLVTGVNLAANIPSSVTMPTGSAANDAKRAFTTTDNLHVVATKNSSAANTVDTKVVFWLLLGQTQKAAWT